MNNFRLYPPVDTKTFLTELDRAIQNKVIDFDVTPQLRASSAKTHKESSWYIAKGNFPSFLQEKEIFDSENSLFVRTFPIAALFPKLFEFLETFAHKEGGLLRRVSIVGLRGEGEVSPHIDRGTYYARTNRYHLVLVSPQGSEFFSGDEKAVFREGELWWFDNKKLHSVKNLSDQLRVHVIFDLLPKKQIAWWERVKLNFYEFLLQNMLDDGNPAKFVEFVRDHPFFIKILTNGKSSIIPSHTNSK